MNILYIGPNESEWAQAHCPGSLAASKWARGFLGGLAKLARVTALTHTYYYPWPKGKHMWSGRDDRLYPSGWECEVVSYPVLKYVREWWWRFGYAAKAVRIIDEKKIDVVLFYNCYEVWQVPVMQAIKTACPHVRIFPIVLDGDDPRKDDWGWLKRAAEYADGFIPLSWWMHENLPIRTGKRSYHLDGGADGWCGVPPAAKTSGMPYSLVHTGALDQWRGLSFMIEVVQELTTHRNDVRFVFCGKSCAETLRERFGKHPRVELPGFVSEERMNEICNTADVLLNVRDPKHPDNILNYPSKLPHYLSFGRPIVSTSLRSLSPAYNQVLHYPAEDSARSYVQAINDVLVMNNAQRAEEYVRIKAWFEKSKTWAILTEGLVRWLEN